MSSERQKRYTFETILHSETQLDQVEDRLIKKGVNLDDIDYLYIPARNYRSFSLKKLRGSHRMSSKGLLFGAIFGFIIGLFINTDLALQINGSAYSGPALRVLFYTVICSLYGAVLFFILGLRLKTFEVIYQRNQKNKDSVILLTVDSTWDNKEKIEEVLKSFSPSPIEEIDHKYECEVGV